MTDDSKDEIVPEDQETSNMIEEPKMVAISFHALTGQRSPSTIRLHGNIGGQSIEVLIGNGDTLNCSEVCSGFALELDGHSFSIDLFVLLIHGVDVPCLDLARLPPQWPHDHHIPLRPSVEPVSMCPYRYPHFQKRGVGAYGTAVELDPSKIQAMTSWPTPANVRQLRGFLGLIRYYRWFVCGYAPIAALLTSLLQKDKFCWTMEARQAFNNLKLAMIEAPVLALPNFAETIVIEIDASRQGIGAVLMQHKHPIAYFSKKLSSWMQLASAYARELCVVTEAVMRWRQYLLGRKFIILSYKWGKDNIATDAFSCQFVDELPPVEQSFLALSVPTFKILQNIRDYLVTDAHCAALLADFHSSSTWPPGYSLGKDVKDFIQGCHVYNQAKYQARSFGGLLQPLPIPAQIWEEVALDFIMGLPLSSGFSVIMGVVDRLTKYAHFGPLRLGLRYPKLLLLFVHLVYKIHSLPKTILNDRDLVFLSNFWRELFQLSGTTLLHNSAYHQRKNGQTEWVCKVAYKLAFPEGSKIHPVFHVSLLKPCSAFLTVTPLQLPPLVYRDQPHITPLAMLGLRIVSHEGVDVPQLLVQWHGLPLEGTSWEDGTTFEAIYEKLSHNLEDMVEVE
ncbi:uncharacterized protein LOC116108204 [Pistacia vera]|uniref:uncharacterized protein LOC116108204 n=1 Tax=Pistacia vera TaxID=55513 RepID=UPI001263AEB9|nr:uncharacterized protein LOC116108204 [Pistacia vera]